MKKFIIPGIVLEIISIALYSKDNLRETISVIAFLLGGILIVIGIIVGIKNIIQKALKKGATPVAEEPATSLPPQTQSQLEAKPIMSQPEEPEKPKTLTEDEKEKLIKALQNSITITFDEGHKPREGVRSKKGRSVIVGTPDFTVIDIETTGLSPKDNEIIELGAVKYRDGEIVSQYQQLINPGTSIPQSITKLTGITDDMVRDAPAFDESVDGFLAFIGDDLLLGHNTNFDINFIYDACVACGHDPIKNDFVDTMRISKKMHPEYPNHKLQTLTKELGVDDKGHHRSVADCIMTAECFLRMLSENPSFFEMSGDAKWRTRRDHNVKIKEIVPDDEASARETPLTGKSIVFTGELTISRREAMQMAVNAGAVIKSSVSSKTDYLVVGKQDIALVGEDGLSTKEEKAYALNESGKGHVQFLNESEFLELLREKDHAESV